MLFTLKLTAERLWRVCTKCINLFGQEGNLSGSRVAVDGAFFCCLVDHRYGFSQGGLRRFWRFFVNSSPDALNEVFYLRSVSFVAKISTLVLLGPFDGRFRSCQSRLLLFSFINLELLCASLRLVKPYFCILPRLPATQLVSSYVGRNERRNRTTIHRVPLFLCLKPLV